MITQPKSSETAKGNSDAELARAAQRGDKRAFVEIVARYQGMVCGIALGILGDFAGSEDAGQEAFLTAWRKIHELREPEKLRGWLGQIARNAALGQRRRQKPFEALEEQNDLADPAPTPDEAAATEEDVALVRMSLERVPETYRLPLILYYREGQSVKAVADSLGISEDAAKQRLARGRELCRERISATVERVLSKTKPSTLFTMAIAVAIGGLAAPSAIAASAFAASAATATSVSTTATVKTTFSAIMTTSKAFLLAAAAVALVCVPIGYQLRSKANAPTPIAPMATLESDTTAKPQNTRPDFGDSALVAQWLALHQTYGTNAQAMPELYEAIKNLKDPFQRQALSSALIAEWSEIDPKGGLAFLLGKGHGDDERQDFFRAWLAREPKAAVAALMASSDDWKGLAHDCLTDIARADPNDVAAIAAQLPKSDNYFDSSVRDAFGIVAQNNLEAARQAAEAMTGPNRDQALAGVATEWAKTDLNAAAAWAKSLPDDVDRNEVIRCALVGKAAVDPVAALDAADLVPSGGSSLYFASTTGARVLSAAASADFDATMAWIGNHPGRFSAEDMTGLAGAVTERLNADPAAFLSARAADGTLSAITPAIESALMNGSSGERTPVWAWLQGQPSSPAITTLETQALTSAGFQDPLAALQMGANLANSPNASQMTDPFLSSLLNGGAALYRFNELYAAAPDALKGPLAEEAFTLLANQNVSQPQTWAANLQYLPASDLNQGAQSLGKAWGGQDPSSAIEWAQGLANGPEQNSALVGIASGWASQDAAGAANWILTLPAGQERDQTTAALVYSVVQQSPSDAWNWALSIGDATERDNAAAGVIQNMAGKNPGAAQQWIDSGPFDAGEKAKLMAYLTPSNH